MNIKNGSNLNHLHHIGWAIMNVERFWKIENYGTVPKHDDCIMTKDEKRALNITLFSLKKGSTKLGSNGGRIK